MRLFLFILTVLALTSCSPVERKAALGDTGEYVGVPARDFNPTVDSDGDGDPANDIDNRDEILGGLIGLIARNPTPAGAVTVLGGLGVFLTARYLARRRRAKEPE